MTTLLRGFHISSLAWVGDFMPIREPYATLNRAQSNPWLKNSSKRIKTPCKKKCCGIKVVKKKTGQTFHFWLTDFLLRQAKLLLLSTDMNVTQIAKSLHFPDSSAFAKFFRKGAGLSPLEYRERHAVLER